MKDKRKSEVQSKMKLSLPKIFPRETLMMALDNVRANKFRSFLTVLGIVIGVMAAIVVASILTGMRTISTLFISRPDRALAWIGPSVYANR